MSPSACLAALLYFLAFARPPAPVGSDEGSIVMPVKSLHTLLLAGAGARRRRGGCQRDSRGRERGDAQDEDQLAHCVELSARGRPEG